VGRCPMLDDYLRKNVFNKPPYKSTEKVSHYDAFDWSNEYKNVKKNVRI